MLPRLSRHLYLLWTTLALPVAAEISWKSPGTTTIQSNWSSSVCMRQGNWMWMIWFLSKPCWNSHELVGPTFRERGQKKSNLINLPLTRFGTSTRLFAGTMCGSSWILRSCSALGWRRFTIFRQLLTIKHCCSWWSTRNIFPQYCRGSPTHSTSCCGKGPQTQRRRYVVMKTSLQRLAQAGLVSHHFRECTLFDSGLITTDRLSENDDIHAWDEIAVCCSQAFSHFSSRRRRHSPRNDGGLVFLMFGRPLLVLALKWPKRICQKKLAQILVWKIKAAVRLNLNQMVVSVLSCQKKVPDLNMQLLRATPNIANVHR